MKRISSVDIFKLRPFKLKRGSIGISLYMACHGRKKTVANKLRNKLATAGYRLLRSLKLKSDGIAVSLGSGKEFCFDSKNSQFHAIYQYYDRGYEPDVMAAIKVFLPADGVFLDIGANWGYFSLAIAEDRSFKGRIVAVEAFPPSFEDFAEIKRQLSIPDERIEMRCMAMSDGPGEIYLDGTDKLYSGLVKVSPEPTEVKVPKNSLDSLGVERVDVIKLDVEGHELAVLTGGARTIDRCRPVIILESNYKSGVTNHGDMESIRYLKSRGYNLYVPMLSDENGENLGLDLRDLPKDQCWLRGMEFEPSQRGFFGLRINVLAIPSEHAFFNDSHLE